MANLVNFKESLIYFYQKREDILRPLLKVLLSFAVLSLTQDIFNYAQSPRLLMIFLVISVIQAFLPLYTLYFTASALIMYNLWNVSADICLGFVLLFAAALLTCVRMDKRTACIIVIIPVLFHLQLEYLIPVVLGITIGFMGIFPALFGTLIYYMGLYTGDASNLLTYSSDSDMGVGLSRVVNLMVIDRQMQILLITFCLVIFITALLYHMFYELAWLFSVTFGNAAMIFLLLCGRYIFELDYAIWKLFLEAILSVLICVIIQFFRGIGDVSRMERASFEDDDYIYYVKAVPKIRVAQQNRNITDISSERAQKIQAGFEEEKENKEAAQTVGKEAAKAGKEHAAKSGSKEAAGPDKGNATKDGSKEAAGPDKENVTKSGSKEAAKTADIKEQEGRKAESPAERKSDEETGEDPIRRKRRSDRKKPFGRKGKTDGDDI